MRIRCYYMSMFDDLLYLRINDEVASYQKKFSKATLLYTSKDEVCGIYIYHYPYQEKKAICLEDINLTQIQKDYLWDTQFVLEPDYHSYVYVGKVVSCDPHPNSDHLKVCKVLIKDKMYQIVCGASNVTNDILVAVALEKAIIRNQYIKKGKLLDVESQGMICSAYELGIIEEKKKGILILDDHYTCGEEFHWRGTL